MIRTQWLGAVLMIVTGVLAAVDGARAADGRGRINLGGIVTGAFQTGFVLDAGDTDIRVEMSEWDWYDDYSILEDERVIISAPFDQASFESRVVKPERVYLDAVRTLYMKRDSERDDSDIVSHVLSTEPVDDFVSLTGSLETVEPERLTLSIDGAEVQIDRDRLPGPERDLRSGSRVWLSARPDREFWASGTIDDPTKLIVLQRIVGFREQENQ